MLLHTDTKEIEEAGTHACTQVRPESRLTDLLSDCQWGGRTYIRTDGMTMRGEGLSCYVQLKIRTWLVGWLTFIQCVPGLQKLLLI